MAILLTLLTMMVETIFRPLQSFLFLLGAGWALPTSRQQRSSKMVAWESTDTEMSHDDDVDESQPSLSDSSIMSSSSSSSATRSTTTTTSSSSSFLFGGGNRLVLEGFVSYASPSDTLALCEDLLEGRHGKVRSITFRDTVSGSNYRRWLFKKTGVYRHVLNVAQDLNISVQFEATVEMDCSQMSPEAVVSVLEAIQADMDVKSICLTGSMHYGTVLDTAKALTALLTHDDRHWQRVHLGVQFEAPKAQDAKLAQKVFYRALQKVAADRYITLQVC